MKKTSTLARSIQGHTPGFDGRDGSTLSAVASAYQLASSDVRSHVPKVADAGDEVGAFADALDAVATCVGGLAGDFYISSIASECPDAYDAFQSRRAAAETALAS